MKTDIPCGSLESYLCKSYMKDVFWTRTSDRREGQRRVASLYLACVVSHAELQILFPVCSEGSKVGLLVVSVIHIFLPPFITQ